MACTTFISQTILLALCALSIAAAQPVVEIPYTTSEITVDGRGDDWEGRTTIRFIDSSNRSPRANRASVGFAWNEDLLYALYHIGDDRLNLLDSHADDLHLHDAVELFIDALGNSRTYMGDDDWHLILSIGGGDLIFHGDTLIRRLDSAVVTQRRGMAIVYRHAVEHNGTVNRNDDLDSGYIVELAIPWTALGIEPQAGHHLRLDVCMDDLDSTAPPAQTISRIVDSLGRRSWEGNYHAVSWSGSIDFGFPDRWRPAVLVGEPSWIQRLERRYSRGWLRAFALTTLLSFAAIGYLFVRLRRLRTLPAQQEVAEHPALAPSAPSASEPILSRNTQLMGQARTFIEEHIAEELNAQRVADALGMSLRSWQRVVREELGVTPTALITTVRLERAAAMLKADAGNVTEVAYAVGFNDSAYFSRLFKRYFGIPPSSMRREG